MAFSVLFNIRLRRWEADSKVAFFFVLFEFAQIALFIVDPVWGWDIDWSGCAARRYAKKKAVLWYKEGTGLIT